DPGVLEVPADERTDGDPLGQTLDTRTQAADPPDDQVDLGAGLGGFVERVDHIGVHERVHLQDDPAALSGLAPDQVHHLRTQVLRGYQQPAVLTLPAVAG